MFSDFPIRTPSQLSAVDDDLRLKNLCHSLNSQDKLLHQRYRLLKPLGQGGFGKTFLARDEQRSEQSFCVLKQLLISDNHQPATELFRQEARCLAEVGHHPQIPQLLDVFEQNGRLFIVQEWIDGLTLAQEALELPFNETEIWTLLHELLPVLQYLHDRNIIHRDIKPANIIRRYRTDTTVGNQPYSLVLVDFGAAKQVGASQYLATGTFIGSAEYAAPEQIHGKAAFASDLYSLGITCLSLLTQMSPFDLYDVSEATWKWHSYLTQPISTSLQHILCTLVQPSLRRRYQSATDVLTALDEFAIAPEQPTTQLKQSIAPSALAQANASCLDEHCTSSELSPAAIAAIRTVRTTQSITTATVYNPQTQRWCAVPSEPEPKGVAYKVALFLSSRVADTTSHVGEHHPLTERHPIAWQIIGQNLLTIGLGTVVASVAMTCLWLCISIIFLALTMPPQSSAIPVKATPSALPQSLLTERSLSR
ncbi:MAG: protein kinase [Leptolyngbya sp. BL-A-14]